MHSAGAYHAYPYMELAVGRKEVCREGSESSVIVSVRVLW